MSDDKILDLKPYGIHRKPDVRVIREIYADHTRNGELSHLVVILKNAEELKGTVIVGSGAEKIAEDVRSLYQQKMDGR
ncbi:MAG: hypothetical protein WCT49_04285 [Candidatus Paceibacterota bacterium]|jgi:hypothetical protein|nr:hypothetical protein [Candidatus Paceibacterota bacterium]